MDRSVSTYCTRKPPIGFEMAASGLFLLEEEELAEADRSALTIRLFHRELMAVKNSLIAKEQELQTLKQQVY